MRSFLIIVIALVTSGCTTLQPIEMSPEELQQKIAEGEIIEVGDKVKVVTADGTVHKFEVSEITADRVSGKDVELLVADIIAIETREFSGGKTAALVAGSTLVYILVGIAVAVGGAFSM